MPAYELVGQELTEETARQLWRVSGESIASIARAVAWNVAPPVFGGCLKCDLRLQELGGGEWDATVEYSRLGSREEESNVSWTFDIGTSNLHITQALEHVQSYKTGGTFTAAHGGAIGVHQDGNTRKVEGCDIVVPVFSWEETHNLPAATVATHAWITAMEAAVAHINGLPFRIWEKGELLLLGISGSHASLLEKNCPVTYKFASSRTKTGMTIGSGEAAISDVDKEGNHYLWIEYEEIKDEGVNRLTKRPVAVHVERVYDYTNLANLCLPDPWS